MRYLIIVLVLLCTGCANNNNKDNKENSKFKWEEVICPKCDGTGTVEMDAGDRVVLGLVTFGLGAMCNEEQCEKCKGTGLIKKRVRNDLIN